MPQFFKTSSCSVSVEPPKKVWHHIASTAKVYYTDCWYNRRYYLGRRVVSKHLAFIAPEVSGELKSCLFSLVGLLLPGCTVQAEDQASG